MIPLPNEIIGDIFDVLDQKEDICNLRLTCKALAVLGERKVFERIQLQTIPRRIESFLDLVERKNYRKYIKRIVYEVAVLRIVDFEDWKGNVIERPFPDDELPAKLPSGEEVLPEPDRWTGSSDISWDINGIPDAPQRARDQAWGYWYRKFKAAKNWYSEEQLFQGYQMYRTLLNETLDVEREERISKLLRNALCELPNLKETILINLDPDSGYALEKLGNLKINLPIEYDDETYSRAVQETARHQSFILNTLGHRDCKVENLRVPKLRYFILDGTMHPELMLFPSVFANLKRLQLDLYEEEWGELTESESRVTREVTLGKLLRQARCLEILVLEFFTISPFEVRITSPGLIAPSWKRLGLDTTWPNLKELRLATIDMTETHAADFMHRHSSLQVLHLSDIFLLEGTWDSTLREFKRALRNLQNVRFDGIFGVTDGNNGYGDGFYGFNPEFHLPMQEYVEGNGSRLRLPKGTPPLDVSLQSFFLVDRDDNDPLKQWGNGVLPEGVTIEWSPDSWFSTTDQ